MLSDHGLYGADLPQGTLCLTFDDGPGPHTAELGEYLCAEGIVATFFLIGQLAAAALPVVKRLRDCGHLLGNHTWSHAGLVDLALAGGDVYSEVMRADAVLRPYAAGPMLFRPPYGSWRTKSRPDGPEDTPRSIVAQRLRAHRLFDDYVGPVMWDVVGEDWECWRRDLSVSQCARRHIDQIERAGSGIVLLHDSSENEAARCRNRTAQMTGLLVPELKAKGFRFVGLTSVPQIRAAIGRFENASGRRGL